jgi:hypothetical protein
MSKDTTIADLGMGEDHAFPCTILNATETAAVDITGWALSWMIKRNASDADLAAILTKVTPTGIVISGTFNATPSVNTQKATVSVLDTDTDLLTPGLYHHELKRTDAGVETTLITGLLELVQRVHHA